MTQQGSPSRKETAMAELFEEGETKGLEGNVPLYAKTKDDRVCLAPESLHEPFAYIDALRDYISTCAFPYWETSQSIGQTHKEEVATLFDSQSVLSMELGKYCDSLSNSELDERIRGISADVVVATWIHGMHTAFNRSNGMDTSLRQWDNNMPIDISSGFAIQPNGSTRFFLMHEGKRNSKYIHNRGEGKSHIRTELVPIQGFDMLVEAGEEALYFINASALGNLDPTLSSYTSNISQFRRKMQNAVNKKRVDNGAWSNIVAMHILSGREEQSPESLSKDHSVLSFHISGLPAALEGVAATTRQNLEKLGILVKRNGAYHVRNQNLCEITDGLARI